MQSMISNDTTIPDRFFAGLLKLIDIHAYDTLTRHDVFQFDLERARVLNRMNYSIDNMQQLSRSTNGTQGIKNLYLRNHHTTHRWKTKGWFEKTIGIGDELLRSWPAPAAQQTMPFFETYEIEVEWKKTFFERVLQLCLWQLIYDTHTGRTNFGDFFNNGFGSFTELEPVMTRLQLLLQQYLDVLCCFDEPTGTLPLLPLLCVGILT
jgi:hypothetical protein